MRSFCENWIFSEKVKPHTAGLGVSAVNWNQPAVLFVAAKLHFFCSETESKSEVKRNRVKQSETVASGVDRGGHHQQQLPSLSSTRT